MTLHLDLSASDAKIARAREHAKALEIEVDRIISERNPYGSRVVEIEENSGWFAFLLTQIAHPPEHTLGIVFGDVIHNLRCALDYIVTALAAASKTNLTVSHQFPIFKTQSGYESRVGDNLVSVPRLKGRGGPLLGITIGLQEIWDVQPFHRKAEPRADPLYVVHRFSNADKHRIIAEDLSFMKQSTMQILPSEGVVEEIRNSLDPDWSKQTEYEVGRVRYAYPFPANVYLKSEVAVEVYFGTPGFADEARGIVIPLGYVNATCDHIAMVVDRFKTL